ncbi:hypothetical protein MBLNU230_g5583t1 [Neophaeotheca triangularis]
MRSLSILRLLALPLLASALSNPSKGHIEQHADTLTPARKLFKREDAPASGPFDGDLSTTTDGGLEGTTFNGKNVPPGNEFNAETLEVALNTGGHYLVEFFSPYCHHCKAFAPTWQTMYEFYYTSDPVPQAAQADEGDMNSFTRYYNFKFGKVDCVANGDVCSNKEVRSFPTTILFKDGQEVKRQVGNQKLEFMSKWVEEILETIRPGSRVEGGPKLPKVGDHEVEVTPIHNVVVEEEEPVPAKGESTEEIKPKVLTTKPAEVSRVTPNPSGKSVPLSAENFQRQVTMTHEPWFIKFYVPWCQHCQALAPSWQGMARQMQNSLNVGEVNCDQNKHLCRDVKVSGYPTLLFFRGGERIEYDGLRGLGDLINFANSAVAVSEGVRDVSAAEFEALEEKEEVIFLYFYDHATTTEDFNALDRLIMSLIGRAKLVKTSDPLLAARFRISTWPRLLVSRDGKATYYNGLSPRDMRDFRRVLNWMQSVWQPIVPEISASNAGEIMSHKLVVLGILSRQRSDEFISAKREIKNAALEWLDKQTQAFQLERQELRDAKQLRIEEAEDRNDQRALRAAKSIRIDMETIERKDVGFAWIDGAFWERWIRQTFGFSIDEAGERVVVYDDENRRYWDVTTTGNPIVPSRTSILETLPRIVSNPPKLVAKSTATPLGHLWWVVRGGFGGHPVLSILGLVGLILTGLVYGRKRLLRGRGRSGSDAGGFFKVGISEKGLGGAMDGLLGGNHGVNGGGQGKVD